MNREAAIRFIVATRHKHKWTQKELADRAGTFQAHISQIEAGKKDLSLDTFLRILSALEAEITLTSDSRWNPFLKRFDHE